MIDKLYDLVDRSNLTLIGYTYKNERAKDQFISRLSPHKMSADSIYSCIRDIKLDGLIDPHSSKYILLDIADISIDATSNINRANKIRHLCENLRVESVKFDYRVIITAPLNCTRFGNIVNEDVYSFSGGIAPMYAADLSFQFIAGSIKVVKNRFGDNLEIPYKKVNI